MREGVSWESPPCVSVPHLLFRLGWRQRHVFCTTRQKENAADADVSSSTQTLLYTAIFLLMVILFMYIQKKKNYMKLSHHPPSCYLNNSFTGIMHPDLFSRSFSTKRFGFTVFQTDVESGMEKEANDQKWSMTFHRNSSLRPNVEDSFLFLALNLVLTK